MEKINALFINELLEKANDSERKRTNYNFHKIASDLLQRMMNVMMPGTYVQPHKHEKPDKREVFIILKGKAVFFEFDDSGKIIDHIILDPEKESFGVEIGARKWHNLVPLEPSVLYEVKDGPYNPANDKQFAPWAPKEGEPGCNEYNKNLLKQTGLL